MAAASSFMDPLSSSLSLSLSLSLFSVRARKRKRRTELNRTAGLTHTVVGCRFGGEEEHRERERERRRGGEEDVCVTGLTSPGERKLTKQRFSFAEVQRMTCLNSKG
jgi:hypothetical protein